jgi:hypothetical protein
MPLDYTSAYAPMQSNAQYGQPVTMGQGQQEAMHQAMLQQQQQYNNQSANIASQTSGAGSLAGGAMRGMMLAQALRGSAPTSGSVELPQIDPQMSGVAGMGDSTGTGVTYGGTNFGQINPYSTGGYGLK